ncbi:hypothetical protein L1987_18624 [Smallanthus sonchifolius]|uniref:Uncharacterized protein n=1 Tax=Smallanthus sonchifolius TaxID=185202 RepID=A0ACB9J132_9ASTR|nr:hypothetical protein L1987_18624 [Smallanthus sonchifolius]
MIKKTEKLSELSQQELYIILESYELEIKKGAVTPTNQSVNTAILAGQSSSTQSNKTSMAYFQTDVPPSTSGIQPFNSTTPQKQSPMIPNDYLPIMTAFMSCYDALISGKLTPVNFQHDDLEQINSDDLEKMDIDWVMAMLALRTNRFIKRTGMYRFRMGKTLGFDIKKVRRYNCDQFGHFARNCKEPSEQHEKKNSNGKQAEGEAADKALMADIEEKDKLVFIQPAKDLTAVLAKKIHDIFAENRSLFMQLTTQKNNNQILTERLQKAKKANIQIENMGMDEKILFRIINKQIHKRVTEGIGYNTHPPSYSKSGRFADMPAPHIPTPFVYTLSVDDYIKTSDSDNFASCAESDCVSSEDDCDESTVQGNHEFFRLKEDQSLQERSEADRVASSSDASTSQSSSSFYDDNYQAKLSYDKACFSCREHGHVFKSCNLSTYQFNEENVPFFVLNSNECDSNVLLNH